VAPKNARAKKSPKPQQVFGKNGVFYTFPHSNQEQIQIRVDFSQVPSPPNYYYADSLHLGVDQEQRMVILSFGQRNPNTDKFSNRIDVVMPLKSLIGSFWLSSRPVETTLDKLLEASGLTGETRPISSPDTEAMTLFANMIFLAVGDGESTLDFYHLAPREVHLAKTQKKDMELEPTVRVIMSSVLTKHFFNTLRPYAEGASDSAPVLERSTRAARSR
jgi:hypothetical protein